MTGVHHGSSRWAGAETRKYPYLGTTTKLRSMRILLTIPLALAMLVAPAQWWELAEQRSDALTFHRVIYLSDGRMAYAAEGNMLSVRNADASVDWEIGDSYMTGQGGGDMIAMPDGELVQVGIADYCDVLGPGRIRRFDALGNVLWEHELAPTGQEGWEDFFLLAKGLYGGSGGPLAVASLKAVRILDGWDGQQIGQFTLGDESNIKKLHWASDSTLFVADGTDLKLVGLNGMVLSDTPIGEGVLDLQMEGTQLFALVGDTIRRFGPALELNGTTIVSGAGTNSSFVWTSSGLYVQTAYGLYHLDAGGTATLLFPWPSVPAYTHTGCVIGDGAVHEVGYTNISGRYTGVFRKLSMDGDAADHHQDVEILVEVDSAWAVPSGSGDIWWDAKADVTAHVVNHGPDTLRSVLVTLHGVWFNMTCLSLQHRLDPTDLAVAPGDTVTLPFGVVHTAKDTPLSEILSTYGQVCITALAPDAVADRDPSDNHVCVPVDFIPLGVDGPEARDPLLLTPNPADRRVTVGGAGTLGASIQLRILDSTGRVALERTVTSPGDPVILDVSSLPPGSYNLEAMGSRARSTARLMVVRP